MDIDDETTETRRTFCPSHLRQPIVDFMENHLCAHPLIPGYAQPSPEGIREWAVREAYTFCLENDLREVWAYLWENWYRRGHWELWARAEHPEIPRLKTTMMVDSHWRRIKHDFLDHFHKPRLDLLAWILVVKLAPFYYRRLDKILNGPTGRDYRHLASWRKDFKAEWKKCRRTPITLPLNEKYRPNVHLWVCTCPYFAKSRFLLCKHLVQAVDPVHPVFFREVTRNRTVLFWSHPLLKPLGALPVSSAISHEGTSSSTAPSEPHTDVDDGLVLEDEAGEDSDDDLLDTDAGHGSNSGTFDDRLNSLLNTLREFSDGIEYHAPVLCP